MKVLVFDASPLIHLGKVRSLEFLDSTKNLIPRLVYDEVVVKGKSFGKDDASYLELLIKKGIFIVVECEKKYDELYNESLSMADIDVLSIAKQNNSCAVIDELIGRRIAKVFGIKTIGSLSIILSFVQDKKLKKQEAKKKIDAMIENGWFCSSSLYTMILTELR